MRIVPLKPQDSSRVTAFEHRIYPPEISEDEDTICRILKSTNLSIAAEKEDIVGQLLVKSGKTHHLEDVSEGAYIYDLSVEPAYRGSRIAGKLLQHFFASARQRGLHIYFNCRDTSYPLVKEDRVNRVGYTITKDEFIPDFYAQWGLDEGAHYIQLSPK